MWHGRAAACRLPLECCRTTGGLRAAHVLSIAALKQVGCCSVPRHSFGSSAARSRHVMSNYSATVEFFSRLCQTQLRPAAFRSSTPPTTGSARRWYCAAGPCSFRAALLLSLTCWLLTSLFPGRHVRCVRGGQRLLLCDVEARGRGLEVARVASVRMVQRAGVCGELRGAGDRSRRQSVSLHFPSGRCFFNQAVNENACNKIKLKDYQDTCIEWFKAILACYQGDAVRCFAIG